MPNPTPHRTPLRRISQGSLFALSRSGDYPDAPHGLGFLEPAMSELVDETETLQVNLDGMRQLSDSLATFNESFASWLYVMNMNALTTDWPQAPTDASFHLAKRRAEQDAIAVAEAIKAAAAMADSQADGGGDKTSATHDLTSAAVSTSTTSNQPRKSIAVGKVKKGAKPKLTAKEKKERSIAIEKVISSLPLEFRGTDPNLHRNMEAVIEGLLNSSNRGIKLTDLIAPPDLTQARVNKCLIALVNRKIVTKDNSTGVVLYHWQGVA